MFIPLPRVTLLVATPRQGDKDLRHLFIILTEPVNGEIVTVNLSSYKTSFDDKSCVLDKGDHPFIKHKSYIVYHRSEILKATQLENITIRQLEQVADDVFRRIIQGLLQSKQTPNKVKKFYRDYINQ
ncbi:hypothetical protein BGC33_10720 [Bathymodiolus thermophilus thioautotrophic gill symbiont]|uniref:PemK-like protein n=1 Tax=Bathymodiolus thermophilus thioautotrophic gill symbiont TaxID=2360 RepID=A0A1J5TUK6_9GAMM|nr:hypothetical protein BGC33_10720 [Bathymodiolus thermophilus thioautotrophic gill symbiont]